jgi:hypothetical protein
MLSYLKPFAKPLLNTQLGVVLSSIRSRRLCHQLLEKWQMPLVNRLLLENLGTKTIAGLFPDLEYSENLQPEQIGPFLLGTYELEIAPWFIECQSRKFSMILDIGAKFGYYAVGMAKWFPNTPVYAFDTDPWARRVTRDFAQRNKASNVNSLGYCGPSWLSRHLSPNSLIICDCEGFEFELIRHSNSSNFATSTLIIECHDSQPWNLTDSLIQEFKHTHSAKVVPFNPDSRPQALPVQLEFLPQDLRHLAFGEPRSGDQRWLYLQPLT